MNDYQMVVAAKNGNNDMLYALYEKYKPFITHTAFKIGKIYGFTREDKQDFVSDAYFSMQKAVNNVQLNKITNSSTWKIWAIFNYILRNQIKRYATKERFSVFEVDGRKKRPRHTPLPEAALVTHSFNDSLAGIDQRIDNSICASKNYESFGGDIDLKITIDSFKKSLSVEDSSMLEMRLGGYTYNAIGKKMGYTTQWIQIRLKDIQQDLRRYLSP